MGNGGGCIVDTHRLQVLRKDEEKRAEQEEHEREDARMREGQAILKRKFDEERTAQKVPHSSAVSPPTSSFTDHAPFILES